MAAPHVSQVLTPKSNPVGSTSIPYWVALAISGLFLSQALPWEPVFVPLQIFLAVVAMVMVLGMPGMFIVGLFIPKSLALSNLALVGLSLVASLLLDLIVGYVLAAYHLLDTRLLFLVIGLVSVALVFMTWSVRRNDFFLCRWRFAGDGITKKSYFLPTLISLNVFVTAIIISVQAQRQVVPSVYLSNLQGKLAGYPNQVLSGQAPSIVIHVNNQGGSSGSFTVQERDNGGLLWSSTSIINANVRWSHRVVMPGGKTGSYFVTFAVRKNHHLLARLHVAYHVRAR